MQFLPSVIFAQTPKQMSLAETMQRKNEKKQIPYANTQLIKREKKILEQ